MNRVGNFSEEKTKRLKEALEHGLGELKTDDEMDICRVKFWQSIDYLS